MLRLVRSLILGFVSFAAALSASAGNTSTAGKAPAGFADLTSNDATKAFSTMYPESSAWLNGSDYSFAFNDGGTYDSKDRTIINQTAADYGYMFDEPTVVNGYAIYLTKRSHSYEDERAPGQWTFEGSDDKANWVTLDTRGGEERENGWDAVADKPVVRYYSFSNKTKYKYYRLNVTGTAIETAKYIEFAELEFFDTNPRKLDVSQFANHQEIKVAGMDEGVTLNRLPVLVRFDPSTMTFGREDHADLAFSQGADDVGLQYEVDTWTETSALVWVRLDTAARGATFKMHWGADVDVASQFRYQWLEYAAVVHFNGASDDSDKYECKNSTIAAARIGNGVDGARTLVDKPFAALSDQTMCAVSGWVLTRSNDDASTRIFSAKDASGNDGMEFMFVKGTGLYLRGNKGDRQVQYNAANNVAFPKNVWTHYTAVLNGETGDIYMNGAKMSTAGNVWPASLSTRSLMMGGYTGTSTSAMLNGVMDELRVYNGVPSDEWVKAEYQAMADENFLTTDAIPSSVELVSIDSDREISKVTIVGNVQLGDGVESETVVIGVGLSEAANDKTYEVADCESGAFTKVITDLEPGRYYFTIALKSAPGVASAPRLVRVGVLPPVEWTGAAADNKWLTPENWSTGVLPQEDDSVVFGEAVSADLSILGGEGALAKKMTITTPYALKFGAIAVLEIEVAETANERNEIGAYLSGTTGSLTINLMDGSDVATWNVPAGKTLAIENLKGRASAVKTGAGTVNLTGWGSDHAAGLTEVREGLLTFSVNKQLGTGLTIGGGSVPAVARANITSADLDPFGSGNRTVSVKANGTLDLTIKAVTTKPWIGVLDLAENAALKLSFGRTEDNEDMPLVVNGNVTIAAGGTKLELAPLDEISKTVNQTYTVLKSVNGEITGDFAQLVTPKAGWKLVKETDESERVKALKVKCAPAGFVVVIK